MTKINTTQGTDTMIETIQDVTNEIIDLTLKTSTIEVIHNLLDYDDFDDDADRRFCILFAHIEETEGDADPDDFDQCSYCEETIEHGSSEYRVLCTEEAADAACKAYIEDSLWAFNASFLGFETGLGEEAFSCFAELCESANDAVRAIVDGTCGIDALVESAICADGRGHFLSHYDGEENEVSYGDGRMGYIYPQPGDVAGLWVSVATRRRVATETHNRPTTRNRRRQ
jgi:hypothetical protein